MGRVRIALAQVNPVVGDLAGNVALSLQAVDQAKKVGAGLVALPELVLTGYPPEDLVLRRTFVAENLEALRAVAAGVWGIAAVVGFVDSEGGRIYNAAALLGDGEVRGIYRKHRLPNYGVFDEERYFEPGEGIVLARIGEDLFGITICEDVWSADGPQTDCATAGAALVININGSPYWRGKGRERLELLRRRAAELKVGFAYVNMVGGQDELVFDGGSCAVAADGTLLARAAQFREELLVFDFEPAASKKVAPEASDAGRSEALRIVDIPAAGGSRSALEPRIADELDSVGEVYEALVLGVHDYLKKNGFTSALVSLSGGIDSSLTAAVARDAIGSENVTGVLMPSDFTSRESLDLAAALANSIGIETLTLPIPDVFEATLKTLDPLLAGTEVGVAEENLQSRIRGLLLMAISNKRPTSIVLSTGNKSEMATGYATLYGDMAGGFAVLKDVAKTLVFELARWRNRQREVIPEAVIERAPTAELRAGQLDTDSLPPYDVLDPILEAYVEEDLSIDQVEGMGYERATVERVAQMVDRAEYKRRQAPPGIKVTERAFGRDRRLPITNRYSTGQRDN